jgi:hypothetical protein
MTTAKAPRRYGGGTGGRGLRPQEDEDAQVTTRREIRSLARQVEQQQEPWTATPAEVTTPFGKSSPDAGDRTDPSRSALADQSHEALALWARVRGTIAAAATSRPMRKHQRATSD